MDPCITKTEAVVTAWNVEGDINYEKLIVQFGTERIDADLMERFSRVTGKELHPWIKRGIFFAHRAMNQFLDAYEEGEPVFLYTGKGSTHASLSLGNLIPFMFTKWLQDVFDCPLVIQMSDDEKYYFKPLDFEEVYRLGFENAKDIIACGFNPAKTFIFSNRDYRLQTHVYEKFVSEMKKNITAKQVAKVFGFGEKVTTTNTDGTTEEHYVFGDNLTVGMMDWPFYQSAAAFYQAFPHIFGDIPAHCLVAYAIDQDPYFRMARDLASKMNLIKPYSIMSTFIPPLTGSSGKMSSSTGSEASLFLTDTPESVREKIMTYAFSGGGGTGTLAEHKKYGGNPDVDISYQYLRYFEFDDKTLDELREVFKCGNISCVEMKTIMADKIVAMFTELQSARERITDADVAEFYRMKPMTLPMRACQTRDLLPEESKLYAKFNEMGIKYQTLYHKPIITAEEGRDIACRLHGTFCKCLLLKGKDEYYLYVTAMDTNIEMKTLPKKLGIAKIRFAEKQLLEEMLNVPAECATVFALMNTPDVKVVFDETVSKTKPVNFHPMRTDATTTISYEDMMRFIGDCGYVPTHIAA